MNQQTFELNLTQLEESFSKSKSNRYSNPKKKKHFNQLRDLFEKIKDEDHSSFDTSDYWEHYQIFQYLFNGLEFLDDSTLNATPYEIVTCLERALRDWIPDESFIIVTSLSNKVHEFSFEGNSIERHNQLKKIIKDRYDFDIERRLIKINLPKVLVRDYLTCVVLYHELGHFIDFELNISAKLFQKKYGKPLSLMNSDEEFVYWRHTMEYFADLFAAQYISDSSSYYLNYAAYNHGDSDTHPATSKRVRIVLKFLNNDSDPVIEEFQNMLDLSGVSQLAIRYERIEPDESDFKELVPQVITDVSHLHAIFTLGWEIWMNANTNFLSPFERRERYHIVNNLIEKSISNFNVKEIWVANT